MNMTEKPLKLFIIAILLVFSSNAWSDTFWKTGKITRTLTDISQFGGCMINISSTINNGCPPNGWVSLDCDAKHSDPGDGQRAFASALIAITLGKKVTVKVDNTKKNNGYCVAVRLDMLP